MEFCLPVNENTSSFHTFLNEFTNWGETSEQVLARDIMSLNKRQAQTSVLKVHVNMQDIIRVRIFTRDEKVVNISVRGQRFDVDSNNVFNAMVL